MVENDFKRWLEEQEYKASTIATQLSSARSIEQAYGDLDQIYERDAFDALVKEFTYSAGDRTAERPNPTKLKLWGDTYRDLAHLRATLSYYRKFKKGSTRLRKDAPLPDKPAVERAIDECAAVGAITFMETYGFSWNSVEYYAVRDGTLFPAKAVFAVAHQYMPSGVALDNKASDGEAQQHLAFLGYEVAKRDPVMLFDRSGQTYEPVAQMNVSTGRRAYRYRPAGASNRTEDAIETSDLAEICRVLFVRGLLLVRDWQATHYDAEHARDGISLLFPMNDLFEATVANALRRALTPYGLDVVTQGGFRYCLGTWNEGGPCKGNLFRTRPDILIRRGGRVIWIVDTKWKCLRNAYEDSQRGISQSDVYQLMAYSQLYSCDRLLMLYPHYAGLTEPGIQATYGITVPGKVTPDQLQIGTVDVSREISHIVEALRPILLDLTKRRQPLSARGDAEGAVKDPSDQALT